MTGVLREKMCGVREVSSIVSQSLYYLSTTDTMYFTLSEGTTELARALTGDLKTEMLMYQAETTMSAEREGCDDFLSFFAE